jgi:hypothetical protein
LTIRRSFVDSRHRTETYRKKEAQLATYVVGADLQAGRLQAVLIEYEPEAIPIHVIGLS